MLACLAYVERNAVRAAMAETPEDSDYTSIQRQIRTLQAASESSADGENAEQDIAPAPTQPPRAVPPVGGVREGGPEGCPPASPTTWTLSAGPNGRCARTSAGAITEDLAPTLERIGITRAACLELAKDFETTCCTWTGQAEHVERVCERGGQRWVRGIRVCRWLLPS